MTNEQYQHFSDSIEKLSEEFEEQFLKNEENILCGFIALVVNGEPVGERVHASLTIRANGEVEAIAAGLAKMLKQDADLAEHFVLAMQTINDHE